MRFCVLGPLEVLDGDVQRVLPRGRTRSLLALLLLHRNEVLSVDRIADALWGPDPPPTPRGSIDDAVSELRDVLGAGAEALVAHPWGYGLRAPAGSVDADDFQRLVARAQNEEPALAVASLREALALWRGPAFADVADEPFLRAEAARLEALRVQAETDAVELPRREPDRVREPAEDGSRKPKSWRRLTFTAQTSLKLIAVAATVAAVATLVVVFGVSRGESRRVVTGPNMVAALDPRRNRLVDSYTVGSVPSNVAVGGNSVWVYNANDKNVSLIDSRTRIVRTVSTGGSGLDTPSLSAGPSSAWVGNGWSGTVSRIDSRSAQVVRTIRLPGERYTAAGLIAASPSEIWVSGITLSKNAPSPLEPVPNPPPPPVSFPPPRLLAWRIDPHTNRVTRTISLGRPANFPRTFVVSGDSFLIRSDYGVARIDRLTGDVKTRLALPSNGCCETAGLAIGDGSLWVIGLSRNVLWRIDPRNGGGVITATIRLPGQPAGVAFGDGAVWVADATGAILKIDPKSNEIVKTIPVLGVPRSLAFGLGRLWIALD